MKATEKQYVFVSRDAAQAMLRLGRAVSEISVVLPGHRGEAGIARDLAETLPATRYKVETWRELLPLLVAYLKLWGGFIVIWYVVVFIAMSFGIINTTLMAVFERMREFGMLKALGMKPGWIIREVLTEAFFLLVLGAALGNVLSYACIAALQGPGIDLSALAAGTEFAGMSRVIYPNLTAADVFLANAVVFVLGLLVSLYPAVKAARVTPIEAMAHT
jgi:ABC-type lipoprotein release transport system permease subunit